MGSYDGEAESRLPAAMDAPRESGELDTGSSAIRLADGAAADGDVRTGDDEKDSLFNTHAAAWASDDGVRGFTERFKYVIATSFLLTSSLSISDYDTPQDEGCDQVVVPTRSTPISTSHVDGLVDGEISPMPLLDVGVLGVLAFCIRMPPRYVLFLFAALLAALCSPEIAVRLGFVPRISYTLRHAPNYEAPGFLAHGVPNPAWVADERVRLQAAALSNVRQLVHEAHALDRKVSEAISAVQEVELVSRGYSLSRPLPPITRIEAATPGVVQPDEGIAAPVQRLTKLRASLLRMVNEVDYACRGAQGALAPLVDVDELELMCEIGALRTLPSHSDMSETSLESDVRSVGTPRMLALTPQATPSRQRSLRKERYSLGDAVTTPPRKRRSVGGHAPSDSGDASQEMVARTHEEGRITIATIRTHFEVMHASRRNMLCHLLSLRFCMQTPMPGGATMEEYWGEVINVLQSVAHQMNACGSKIAESVTHSMKPDSHDTVVNAQDALHEHPGLADRIEEMARMLRAIQCKLHVFGEDLALGRPKLLHGMTHESSCTGTMQQQPRVLFDSIRNELLALSSEWEQSLRIIDAACNPPPRETPPEQAISHGTHDTTPDTQVPHAASPPPAGDDHGPELFATEKEEKEEQNATHTPELFDGDSSTCLTPPGLEEVFETVSSQRPARSHLSRAERIKKMHEQRASPPKENVPLAMISELRGIIAAKHPERGDTASLVPPLP